MKLRLVPDRLATLGPRLRPAPVPDMREGDRYGSGRGGRPWRRLRAAILERDGHLCQCDECRQHGRLLLAREVDHIIPAFEGGTDDPSNLRAINVDCHRAKTAAEAARARRRPT